MIINHGQSSEEPRRKPMPTTHLPAASPSVPPRAASPQTAPIEVPRGLKGVIVTDTVLGDVRGAEGFYHYPEFDAVELAESRSFEDVWHLMVRGTLPTPQERDRFARQVAPLRHLP